MKTLLASLALSLFIPAYALSGCTNSLVGAPNDGGSTATRDATTTTTTDPDGGSGEDAAVSNETDGGPSVTLPDGGAGIAPNGNLLVPSPSASVGIIGVTSDDYVVYLDTSTVTPAVYAISIAAGSKPISLGLADVNENIVVAGKAVLFETNGNKNGVGQLLVWTSAASAPAVLSTASCSATPGAGMYAVSPDDEYVLFFDDSDTTCSTGTLSVAAIDGSNKTPLVSSVDLAGNVCNLMLSFAGDDAVAGYCVTESDAGAVLDSGAGANLNIATVSAFSPPGWTRSQFIVGAQPGIVTDPAGSKFVLVGPNGTAAYPLDGGAPVTIDPNGELGAENGTPGLLADDAGTLVYTTTSQALQRASTTAPPNPTQLAPSGFADVMALSPNQSWVIGTLDTSDYPAIDLYLVSLTAPGAVTTLASTASATISGDAFTADSSRALYLTTLLSNGSGALNAKPVAGGTPSVINPSAVTVFSPSGTKVVFAGNFDANSGIADILVGDVSTTAAPTVLVSAADPSPRMNAAKTTIVYSWSYQPGALSGIWALSVP
jgi:hypothetical protein